MAPCCIDLLTKIATNFVVFEVGEIVLYKERYHQVELITKPLGYDLYDIYDLVSSERHRAFNYQLS